MSHAGYKQFCPLAMAAEVLCTRWTMVLMRELVAGSTRFNDLRRGVPKMSPTLLSQRLKELERAGIVTRRAIASETGVYEYRLTDAGRDIGPVVEAMGSWGQKWVESELSLRNLDPSLLMWDMRRNLNPEPLPRTRTVVQFLYSDLPPTKSLWWLVVEPRARSPVLVRPRIRGGPLRHHRPADDDRDLDGTDDGGARAPEDRVLRRPVDRLVDADLAGPEPLRGDREARQLAG